MQINRNLWYSTHLIKIIDIPSIEINGTKVDCVYNFNLLGLVLDTHLNWKGQTSKTANEISRTIGVQWSSSYKATTSAGLGWPYMAGGLCRGGTCSSGPTVNAQQMRPHMRGVLWRGGPYKRGTTGLTKLKQYLPSRILLTIYNTLIVPHLNYGILAWGYQPGRLVTLQAVRAITSSAYTAHTNPIFKNLHLLKIYDIHTLQHLKFYYKMVYKNLPINFNTLSLIRNRDIHGNNTRCRNKIGTVRTKHEFAKRCIRYSL